ncbi:MAG: MATE family efflux transporter [Christensenellaceae bacterium]|nr:MATE family efflux transporter [Christensenellaceae bacterium]
MTKQTVSPSSADALGREPVGKLLLRLALPAILAQVINMLYNIVDRIYIGHIEDVGHLALTGVGVTFPLIMFISAFSALAGMGGGPRAAICLGKQDKEGAERILGGCTTLLLVMAVVLTAVMAIFGEPLLLLLGASADTLPYALEYLNIYLVGTVFVMLSLGLNNFISTQGFAKVSMLTVVIGAVFNIALDPLFMFAFGMGVKGAAVATVLSQAVSAVWVVRFLTGKKTVLRIRKKHLRLRAKVVLPVMGLGISPFIMQSTESILNICFNTSLLAYGGDPAVGTMTILSSIMQMFMLPLMGLTQGARPIISYNFGAGNTGRVKKAFRLLLTACIAYSGIFWLAVQLAPGFIVSLFASNKALIGLATWALPIYLAAGLLMGVQLACQQSFIALGQARSSLFLALLRKVVLLIPLIYILPGIFDDKVFAVFLCEPVADVIAVGTTLVLFLCRFGKILRKNEEELKKGRAAQAGE